jgi:hypothetical protein
VVCIFVTILNVLARTIKARAGMVQLWVQDETKCNGGSSSFGIAMGGVNINLRFICNETMRDGGVFPFPLEGVVMNR